MSRMANNERPFESQDPSNPPPMTAPTDKTTVIATYRVSAERAQEFERLLAKHHPKLVELGLATSAPATIYRGVEHDGAPIYFEIFEWVDAAAPGRAHEHPDVMALWEPMGSMTEDRATGKGMNFPHVERMAGPA